MEGWGEQSGIGYNGVRLQDRPAGKKAPYLEVDVTRGDRGSGV